MVLPDTFIDHDKPEKMYEGAGLNAPAIVTTALNALGIDIVARKRVDRG
jgi:1-deoxy-D-xylulose-5-phosphate synthase